MRKKGWVLIPICVAVLFIIIFKTVFLIGYVPSVSMEPTLKKGSIILGVRCYQELEIDDIIIFRHNGQLNVKRIAAIEGEGVVIDGKILLVPEDCYYVLGDNMENSYDSRFWEEPFVKRDDIIAKII